MRPPTKVLQTFSLLIGAMALVLSSAGLVGASQGEVDESPGEPAAEMPEHAAEKQGGPNHVDAETDDDDTTDDSTNDDVAADGDTAHPSGKDRSVEPGTSGDQGKATSDPDGDTNGGADKPGGEGGVDTTDQDGNNGCGNDNDFEDDNKGLCLGPDGAPGQQADASPDTGTDTDVDDGSEDDDSDEASGNEMVTLCHATGSETNPYVVITVSENAVLEPAGHGAHEDDIIPAFDGFDGQGDLDLIAAGCEVDTDVDDTDTDTDTDTDDDVVTDVDGDSEDNDEVTTGGENPDVEGDVVVRNPVTPAVRTVADRNPQVLGSQVTRSGQLARTGDGTINLVPFGLGLVLLGFGLQRTSARFGDARG